jgi:hypothetical protein
LSGSPDVKREIKIATLRRTRNIQRMDKNETIKIMIFKARGFFGEYD